ncbi:MAG TPA: DinB family protein [Gemmatimonadales bacterium]|nr:DinB family protein [Gemmatimonadales bacterium]
MSAEALLAELEREAKVTRRLLERVPAQHLAWRPGPKAMALGPLALHVASIPGSIAGLARLDGLDAATVNFEPAMPAGVEELVPALEAGLEQARVLLRGFGPEAAAAPWRLTSNGKEVFTIPKAALIRTLMLNHWYHHRGQLVVYFRCLDVPVPAVYGRSADEKLFG